MKGIYKVIIFISIILVILGVVLFSKTTQEKEPLIERNIGQDGIYNLEIGKELIYSNKYSIIVNEHVSGYTFDYYDVSLFSKEGEFIKNFTQGYFINSLRDNDLTLIGTLEFTNPKSPEGPSKVIIKSFPDDTTTYDTYTCVVNRRFSWVEGSCKSIKEIAEECGDLEFVAANTCN